jgi:AcrR family transcriptional regulator
MDLVAKQREERRQRILDVARRLIAERGYEGVTMRELADESLVSVPTLYNLFGGKSELLFAAVEAYFRGLLSLAHRSGDEEGLPKVLAVCETLGASMPRHAEYARSLMSFFGGAQESTQLREFVARELTNELVVALEQMQAKKQLVAWVDCDALGERLATLMIMTSFEWAAQHLSDRTLGSAMLFGAAAMIHGFARGKSAVEIEQIVRDHQADAVVPRREVARAARAAAADEPGSA